MYDNLNQSNRPLNYRRPELDDLNRSDEDMVINNRNKQFQSQTPVANTDIHARLDPNDYRGVGMNKSGFSQKEVEENKRNN